uniref:B9 domain-containing protein 2 n=1 Tax=Globisporangium ultimum (strain ATCC 200006 / CBS 805.95 / DAOM BR144) TaxID=431595 RepID=K3X0Z1_GLOUD
MPSLHVIGEILGASGLSNECTLSLSHVVDLLSLHASSQHSFFCRWRLLLGDSDDDEAQVGWRSSSWELLQGDAHGQTQVHSPSASLSIPLTCNNGDVKSSHGRSELLELVWAHPIDLHLTTTSAHVSGWPHLVFQVWSLDCFHQQQLCGTAKVCIPSACGELLVDTPLVRTLPDSWLDRAADSLSLSCSLSDAIPAAKHPSSALTPVAAVHNEAQDPAESGTLDAQGTLLLRIAVLPFGFASS